MAAGARQCNNWYWSWDRGNEKFPDMPGLAADIRRAGARAGIWIRPLQASADTPDAWRLPRDHGTLDPSPFRGAQHGAFYVADADCVGVTNAVPWSLNRQWLDLLARSGTMLFVSLAPDALGADQRRDVRDALSLAAVRQPLEPLDWQHTVYPERWRLTGRERIFDWVGADGAGLP